MKKKLTQALVDNKVVGIAYETVQLPDRSLPLLTPMSEVAGRVCSSWFTIPTKFNGGMGILLGGVPGYQKVKYLSSVAVKLVQMG